MRKVTLPVLWLLFLFLLAPAYAQDLLAIPDLKSRVTDQTGTLSEIAIESISNRLQELETKKGSQVAVLLVATTRPETIDAYSIRVVEQWKLGRKNMDDGVLFLIVKEDRTMRIEVGYGLEGALTDALSRRIIDEMVTPLFSLGDFGGGIRAGVDALAKVIEGETLPEPEYVPPEKEWFRWSTELTYSVFVLSCIGGFFGSFLYPVRMALAAALISIPVGFFFSDSFLAILLQAALIFLGSLCFFVMVLLNGDGNSSNSRRSSSGWGSSSGGRSSSGGGGGYSGGGGSFGGGGASGKW